MNIYYIRKLLVNQISRYAFKTRTKLFRNNKVVKQKGTSFLQFFPKILSNYFFEQKLSMFKHTFKIIFT